VLNTTTANDSKITNLLIKVYIQFLKMNSKKDFKLALKNRGFSEDSIEELWKWYDFSKKKGVASF